MLEIVVFSTKKIDNINNAVSFLLLTDNLTTSLKLCHVIPQTVEMRVNLL